MFRNLFLLIAIGLLFWIIQGFIRRNKQTKATKTISKNTVQCQHCKTYLATEDAILDNGHYFCCQQHLNDWVDHS